ncbi:hypothetical protein KEK_19581 [Mycolicibacterium thermoresistibile ATCC 19527]|uniref:Uncharacterized protein n=1 Tax=Mycolicibacterium thermoresistibile (strain ATCC 19527 / DSM 44167 / CIP 105390 / JCM 6362 / NCTC 10409 / 316) TaxID=1078020 RepID=G7CLM4_MYCT3|nr:hypothetical protein KEK_19581 [Mycolicibacterium thermoresistibile ATCC 19527]
MWQDPIMNWSPFAVYNPELWHLPEDWPLCRRADRRAVRWRNSVR